MSREVERMSTIVKAVYEDGVFKPKEPVLLEEHTELEVVMPAERVRDAHEPAAGKAPMILRPRYDEDDPTGWKAIDELIGCLKGTPPDVSENHDKYIYGDPDD